MTAQFDYLDGQLRPSHPALLAEFAAASERAVKQCQPELDIAYGPHPRQRFDLFRPAGPRRGALAYVHGGYWQSRDKQDFRFLAPPLVEDGWDVALADYPLCPDVGVAEIVEAVAAFPPRLAEHAPGPLVLVGHSAGGQIVAELALRGAGAAGIIAISGVFDLEPLIETSLNAKLGLDPTSACAASPIHRVHPSCPALFAVGGGETDAFQAQSRRMCDAWRHAGNESELLTVPDADHFSILTSLTEPGAMLRAALGRFC